MFNYYRHTKHTNWMDIHRFAKSHGTDWTYIIFGSIGPTGKTYLADQLRKHGYNAIEITEEVSPLVDYRDKDNHYIVYEHSKCVVIILNKPLNRADKYERCPLCGGKVYKLPGDLEYPFGYGCTECYTGAYGYTEEDTKDIWNSIVEKCKDGNPYAKGV